MSSVPDCAWVRGYVLNKLQEGPVSVADLIRFGEAEFGFLVPRYKRRVNTSRSSARIGTANCIGCDLQPVRNLVGLDLRERECPPAVNLS